VTTRLARLFDACDQAKKKVLVAYLCMGDPSPEESVVLALASVRAGADVLELGVPFSDPTADGPSIARASQRAIRNGGGLSATLAAARAIRAAKCTAPIVLFGYYNPLYVHGEAKVVDDAADAGVDAFLVVDLPLDEGAELRTRARERGLAVVPLVTPTSAPDRIEQLKMSLPTSPGGFLYYVSVTGVTGSRTALLTEASERAGRLRAELALPVVVGFGIDTAEKAREASRHVNGVVVGTAIVRAIEDGTSAADRVARVETLVASLRQGLDSAS
jgi:tryptophan synthase alpha chain